MIRPILTHPDPILREISIPVPAVTEATLALLDDMLETMYQAEGRGLAAVQIGVLQRVAVVDTDWKQGERNPLFFVNPTITWSSETMTAREEGCLSIPNQPRTVKRPERVKVSYLDRNGVDRVTELDGMLAMVIQHEIDHLDGVLILDHVTPSQPDPIT
ncbi:peptide deformylase [Mesorhizobium sp. BR1-1-16]|uniref:peptide deformylase n=1 Tax=Mesorhizobium sp. BR1-1-16 TaxID=2876653 RepID=UPI001CCF5496|nr:peptide deformylase [Mesorhizobium sp. BR1-1-16]MBZ9939272.1 peptide deformylase [Mesorhizobium sp. BR1-1-16]